MLAFDKNKFKELFKILDAKNIMTFVILLNVHIYYNVTFNKDYDFKDFNFSNNNIIKNDVNKVLKSRIYDCVEFTIDCLYKEVKYG